MLISKNTYLYDEYSFQPYYRYSNGNSFGGFFKDGLRHGFGSLKYLNGSSRDGEWKNDKMNGFIFHHILGESSASIERWADGVRISIASQPTVR